MGACLSTPSFILASTLCVNISYALSDPDYTQQKDRMIQPRRRLESPCVKSMTSYNLDPGEPPVALKIRILEICPSTTVYNELRCRIFHITLDTTELHPYEALSYVWGIQGDITCNKKPISLTLNIFGALRSLCLLCHSRSV